MVIVITIATFFATLLGGFFALQLKDRLHLILGFSAGAVIAVAFFDLLPEALTLGKNTHSIGTLLSLTALGFLTYLVLDRFVLMHDHTHAESNSVRAGTGAGSLSFHSFLDGVGIGLGFHVSIAVGAIIAAAVLTHDFSDGINTVNMVLKNGGTRRTAFRWLTIDAVAPVVGVIITYFFTISEGSLSLLLALFAGFFLYIGASDLIPESYHAHPVRFTTYMTVLGAVVLYIIVRLASL